MAPDLDKEKHETTSDEQGTGDNDKFHFPSAFPSLLADFVGNVSGLVLRDVNTGLTDLRGLLHEKDGTPRRLGNFTSNADFEAVCKANSTAMSKPFNTHERMLEILQLPSDLRRTSTELTFDQWTNRLERDIEKLNGDMDSAMKEFGTLLKPFGSVLGGIEGLDKLQQSAREKRSEYIREMESRSDAPSDADKPVISRSHYSESVSRTVDAEGNSVTEQTINENGKTTTVITKTLPDGTTERSETSQESAPANDTNTPLSHTPTHLPLQETLDNLSGLSSDILRIPLTVFPRMLDEVATFVLPEESSVLVPTHHTGCAKDNAKDSGDNNREEAVGDREESGGAFGGLLDVSLGKMFGALDDLGRSDSTKSDLSATNDGLRVASNFVMESRRTAVTEDGTRIVETTRNENGRTTTTVEHRHPDGQVEVTESIDGVVQEQANDSVSPHTSTSGGSGCHGDGLGSSSGDGEAVAPADDRDSRAKSKNQMSVTWSW